MPAEADGGVRLRIGTLEASNVSAVGELLKMMDLAREFETSFNLMQNSDENYKRLQSILRVN